MVKIRYTLEEVPGRGWIARAPDLRATAQGSTNQEAFANLKALVQRYPDLLDELFAEVRKDPSSHMELVPA
jgi:predicted RNase H-like HicB family nuclease